MDEDKFWPPREIVEAIPEQALLVCRIIRETLHTTAADSVGKLPFGTNPIPGILTELNKLTYLFYGRTLEDFEADRNKAPAWPLTDWIVATPSALELPMIQECSDRECDQMLVADGNGWPNPIPEHIESLFFGLTTLRCYFGQLTWSRGQWIREGEWLREQVAGFMGFMGGAALSEAEWFQYDFCRHPTHILRPPERYLSPNQQKAWPIMPEEIERCGTHEQPKTDGLPAEWLEAIETRAKYLTKSLEEAAVEMREVKLANSDQATVVDGNLSLRKPWAESTDKVSIERLSAARLKVESLAYEIEIGNDEIGFLLQCLDPIDTTRLSPEHSIHAICRRWQRKIETLRQNMMLDRDVEVFIETAWASHSQPAIVTFPYTDEIAPACGLQVEREGEKTLHFVGDMFIRPGEQPRLGMDFGAEVGGDPIANIRPSKFIYPTAHEAISMAARNLVSLLHLNDEYGEQALQNSWLLARYAAIAKTWYTGIAELRARIGSEYALALECLKQYPSEQSKTAGSEADSNVSIDSSEVSRQLTENAESPLSDSTQDDQLSELGKWNAEELKGKQRRVIELIIEYDCKCPLSTLANDAKISWEKPIEDSWNGIRKALNKKLQDGWQLSTHDGQAILSKTGQK